MKNISIEQAKSIPIISLLAKWGFTPVRVKGSDYWYKSIFRDEQTASMKINTARNVFIDFGDTRYKGTLIDLGISFRNCTVGEFLQELNSLFFFHQPNNSKIQEPHISTIVEVQNSADVEIKKIRNLGFNNAITEYLQSRNIELKIACSYLKEVYYLSNNKHYFALGLLNNSDGWEVRNKYFKGCLGKKDVATISRYQHLICVFEGFLDFISALQMKLVSNVETDILVLNSNAMIGRAIKILSDYKDIKLFLDNDNSGMLATQQITEMIPYAEDKRSLYHNFKDINEYLKSKSTEIKSIKRNQRTGL